MTAHGFTVVELLVASAVGLLVLGALAGGVGAGGRLLLGVGARLEADDTVVAASEALAFDVRRAGFDPGAAGQAALAEAAADGLVLDADLDADGAIDAGSEEHVRWTCNAGPPRLSRVVGAQSLPVASGVTGCAFSYADAAGDPIAVPPGGLDAAARAAVRTIALDLALRLPGLQSEAVRRTVVALRGAP